MSSLEEKFDRVRAAYPPQMRASLVVPLLQIMQEEKGHLGREDARIVADYTGAPLVQVMEALSWYTMLFRQPVGRHVIKLCRNIACSLRGAERMLGHLEHKLGVKAGETTADRRFTLLCVECLASCGTAPAMQVDDTYHEELSEAKIDRILEDLA
jgi:NADH-quinone oxidoreductase subunit E